MKPVRRGRACTHVRVALQTAHSDMDIVLYSDSKWCVDMLKNIEQYTGRKWTTKGKRAIKNHDIWEDIYAMITMKLGLF